MSVGIWLREMFAHWEGIVTNNVVILCERNNSLNRSWWWQIELVFSHSFHQGRIIVYTSISCSSWCTNIYVNKFIIGISQSQEQNAKEVFVVKKFWSTSTRLLYRGVLSIDGSNTAGIVPFFLKFCSYIQPLQCGGRCLKKRISKH